MAFLFALFNIYAIANDAMQPTPQDTVVTQALSCHVLIDATAGHVHDIKTTLVKEGREGGKKGRREEGLKD
jgi:hypothetical protein